MGRILCIDYGLKRTGIAVTDPFKIIATAVGTIPTAQIFYFLKKYFSEETVELVLVGEPRNLDDSDTDATPFVRRFVKKFQKTFPDLPLKTVDERFSSVLASRAMIEMGMKKKERQVKGNIDQVAATMMLQEYLASGK